MGRNNSCKIVMKQKGAAVKKDGFKERKEGFMKGGRVRVLTEEELARLKAVIFEAFEDFDRVARIRALFPGTMTWT